MVFAGSSAARGGQGQQDALYSMMMMRMMSDQLKLDVVPKKLTAPATP